MAKLDKMLRKQIYYNMLWKRVLEPKGVISIMFIGRAFILA